MRQRVGDRDRAGELSGPADRRRGHHRARRDGAGADHRPARGCSATTAPASSDHPRPRGRGGDRRPGAGHVRRAVRGGRPADDVFERPAHPYTRGPARCRRRWTPRAGRPPATCRAAARPRRRCRPAACSRRAARCATTRGPDRQPPLAGRSAPAPSAERPFGRVLAPRAGDVVRGGDGARATSLVLRRAAVEVHFPLGAGRACSGRWTASTSTSTRGRDARPGRRVRLREVDAGQRAAAPRPAHRGHRHLDGTDLTALGRRAMREMRRRAGRWCSRTRSRRSTPRMTVARRCREPLAVHGLGRDGGSGPAAWASCWSWSGSTRRGRPVSARVLRRAAAAGRDRPRARRSSRSFLVCDEAIASLDVACRRRCSTCSADLQRRARADAAVHLPRPLGDPAHLRPDRRHVPGPHRRDRPGLPRSAARRRCPTRRRCCPRSRCRIPSSQRTRQRIVLRGDVPSPAAVPSGCRFRTRCPAAFEPCPDVDPALQPVGTAPDHVAACHLHGVVGVPVDGAAPAEIAEHPSL